MSTKDLKKDGKKPAAVELKNQKIDVTPPGEKNSKSPPTEKASDWKEA